MFLVENVWPKLNIRFDNKSSSLIAYVWNYLSLEGSNWCAFQDDMASFKYGFAYFFHYLILSFQLGIGFRFMKYDSIKSKNFSTAITNTSVVSLTYIFW